MGVFTYHTFLNMFFFVFKRVLHMNMVLRGSVLCSLVMGWGRFYAGPFTFKRLGWKVRRLSMKDSWVWAVWKTFGLKFDPSHIYWVLYSTSSGCTVLSVLGLFFLSLSLATIKQTDVECSLKGPRVFWGPFLCLKFDRGIAKHDDLTDNAEGWRDIDKK